MGKLLAVTVAFLLGYGMKYLYRITVHLSEILKQRRIEFRITSYNVCYTKLLRYF